jgi:hypothetical protein
MGAWGSREVVTQTRDNAVPFSKLFINFVSFGFGLGLLIHDHEISIWSTYFSYFSLLTYIKGLYFFWYCLTWYIVYAGVYILILESLMRPFLFALVGYRREIQSELLVEVFCN